MHFTYKIIESPVMFKYPLVIMQVLEKILKGNIYIKDGQIYQMKKIYFLKK